MTDFALRLKEAMDDKKINAAELSRLSGVGKNLISYYLHGRYLAKQDKVYKLAEALDVDPGWLIYGYEEYDEEPADYYLRTMTEQYKLELTIFSELYINMTPKKRKMAMRILQSIADEEDDE